jgi:hypothetical protein
VSEKDGGMYHALQKGFARSNGEIMGWINSDDVLHHRSLFTLAQLFRDFEDVNWIQGHPNSVDERGRIVSVFSWPSLDRFYFYPRKRILRRYLQQESTFWRRSLWLKAGGYMSTDYKYAGDFELWMRFFKADRLHNIKAFLGSFRISGGGQASIEHFDQYVEETYKVLQRNPLLPHEMKKLRRIERLDDLESFAIRLFGRIRSAFGLTDRTATNNEFVFDHQSQRFVRRKRGVFDS